MAEDFDDYMDEVGSDLLDNDKLDADLKRSLQDANDGYTYTMGRDEDGLFMQCNKCGRKAPIMERPFPHKYACPMRDRIID